jgi:hypothetical protein
MSTKGIFIHGPREGAETRVKFKYYGKEAKSELGDLIFILSIIYKGEKHFEKFTISQFKKDDTKLKWSLCNRKQLYLLSRFPPFSGISGSIIPRKQFDLPNYSGCLGSFCLLYRPGDFAFVSAKLLKSYLRSRNCFGFAELAKFWELSCCYCWACHNITYPIPFAPPYFGGVLGLSCFASNIYEFVNKYLRAYIGELTFSSSGQFNIFAHQFLKDLMRAIKAKAGKEKKDALVKFVKEFFAYPYAGNRGGGEGRSGEENIDFDYEGGGIGIIYTSINLGEGE